MVAVVVMIVAVVVKIVMVVALDGRVIMVHHFAFAQGFFKFNSD